MEALTRRQRTVLQTLRMGRKMTASDIGVRSDVLWRMEERGMVARNLHEQWHILPAGEQALDGAADQALLHTAAAEAHLALAVWPAKQPGRTTATKRKEAP